MKLTHRRQDLRLRHRFATSRGGIDAKQTLVVEFSHDGVIGRGEVAASALYGQTLESSEAALYGMRDLLGDDPFAIQPMIERCVAVFDDQRAAIAGLDGALHDWVGRRLAVPIWRLLGLARPRVRTTFTIGIAPPDEIRVKTAEAIANGYSALKVKVGGEDDVATLRAIRDVFGGPLLLDANEAWTPDVATDRIRELAEFRPAMIEQPLKREHWRHMAALRELGLALICADEDCQRPADVIRLHGFVDGINVKFTKCGGIIEARKMIALARGLGMGVMLGCFISSGLAIAPALAIAGLADFVDLDGHLLLAEDPFPGIIRYGAELSLPEDPGVGVESRYVA